MCKLVTVGLSAYVSCYLTAFVLCISSLPSLAAVDGNARYLLYVSLQANFLPVIKLTVTLRCSGS